MLLKDRAYEREEPSREAKSIYIFCEGVKREKQYFNYFEGIDSRIRVKVYPLDPHEDNSPLGLLKIAKECIVEDENNPYPKYSLLENDEVWIILDTDQDKVDSRKSQIDQIRTECNQTADWFLAQSNPCFEVWLYYHFLEDKPTMAAIEICANWKKLVNASISGGFNSRRHPIYLENAIVNAENNFESHGDGSPVVGCTDVSNLAKSIFSLVKEKINAAKKEHEQQMTT